jgi:hypothetical protein
LQTSSFYTHIAKTDRALIDERPKLYGQLTASFHIWPAKSERDPQPVIEWLD